MKQRLTRLAAALTLTALAGLTLTTTNILTADTADSGWGAPDTTSTTVTVDTGAGIAVTLGDSGWG